jgi:hypothetical protein
MPGRIHTAKFDRCVKKVATKSRKVNPYAVCTKKLGYKASVLKSHQKRIPNWESPIKTRGQARQAAIDYQDWSSKRAMTYGELNVYQNKFRNIGKRFRLVREFKENGII